MKLHVPSIPESGKTVRFTQDDPWFRDLIAGPFKDFTSGPTTAEGEVQLFRTNANVSMNGQLQMKIHPACDRCAGDFPMDLEVKLHRHMAPFFDIPDEQREEGVEIELNEEDLDFSTYHHEEINLADIVAEEVLLALPMRFLCQEDCRGLCAHCGANLNTGPCQCSETNEESPFAVLKGQKFPPKP